MEASSVFPQVMGGCGEGDAVLSACLVQASPHHLQEGVGGPTLGTATHSKGPGMQHGGVCGDPSTCDLAVHGDLLETDGFLDSFLQGLVTSPGGCVLPQEYQDSAGGGAHLTEEERLLQVHLPDLPSFLGSCESPGGLHATPWPPHHPASSEQPSHAPQDGQLGREASSYPWSEMPGEHELRVSSPACSAKTGSQSFDFIAADAVLETHGIPAHLRQALSTSNGGDAFTSKPCGTPSIEPKVITEPNTTPIYLPNASGTPCTNLEMITVPNTTPMYLPEPCGTVSSVSEVTTVPTCSAKMGSQSLECIRADAVLETHGIPAVPQQALNAPDCGTHPSKPCGILPTDTKLITVPNEANRIISVNKPTGTQLNVTKVVTVLHKPMSNLTYLSESCGTPSTVPDNTTSPPDTNVEARTTSRKRRRQQRQDKAGSKKPHKTRLYEHGPQSDKEAEQRRKDAIRAKRGRDRNRNKMEQLEEKLLKTEKERDQLAKEVASRRSHEEAVRRILLQEFGILVTPFGTSTEMVQPALQNSG